MPDIELGLSFNEDSAVSGLKKVTDQLDQMAQKTQGVNDEVSEFLTGFSEGITEFTEQLEQGTAEVDNLGKGIKSDNAALAVFNKFLEEGGKKVSFMGLNLTEVVKSLKAKEKALDSTGKGVTFLSRTFGVLKTAIAATGIGLLLIILGALYNALRKSQPVLDFFSRKMAAVGAVFGVLTDTIGSFLKNPMESLKKGFTALVKFAVNPIGALIDLGRSTKELGEEMLEQARKAERLAQTLIDVQRANEQLEFAQASLSVRLAELSGIIDDNTKSYAARLSAAREFNSIETGFINAQLDLQKQAIAGYLGIAEVTAVTMDQLRRFAEEGQSLASLGFDVRDPAAFKEEVKTLFGFQKEQIEANNEAQKRTNSLLQEEAEKRKRAADQAQKKRESAEKEFNTILKTIQKQTEQLELEKLTGEARLRREQEFAIREINTAEATAHEKAKIARIEFSDAAKFEALRQLVNEQTEREITKVRFEESRKRIEQTRDRLLAETELLSASAEAGFTLEEFRAKERNRIQRESLQELRRIAVQEFGEGSVETLKIDVEIGSVEAGDAQGIRDVLQRVIQERLRVINETETLDNLEVELLKENKGNVLDLEQEKQQARLQVQLKALQARRDVLGLDRDNNLFELRQIDLQIAAIGNQLEAFDRINLDPILRFKKKIQETLRLSDEDLSFVTDGVTSIFDSLGEGVEANRELQLTKNKQLLDQINQNIEELSDKLKIEEERRAAGTANSVESTKQALEAEQAARKKALAEREELEKKAVNARVRQAVFEQGQNLLLGVSKIIAAESGKGLLALITIGVAIAGIYAAFARARSEAAKIEAPELAEGAHLKDIGLLVGPSHREGGIDMTYRDRAGRRRLVNVEGGEFLTNADTTEQFLPFLTGLNRGDSFAEALAGLYRPSPITNARIKGIDELKARKDETDQAIRLAVMKEAYMEAASPMVSRLEAIADNTLRAADRPDRVALPDGYIEIQDTTKGTTRRRVRVKE